MKHVLVVDDEPQLRRLLRSGFAREGYDVEAVAEGNSAVDLLGAGGFDLVVLDLGLPGLDGVEVLQRLRSWSEIPVIVLSARRGQSDKLKVFKAGADDFVEKPFAIEELTARAAAVLKRSRGATEDPLLSFAGLTIDLARRLVLLEGRTVRLTPTEYRLLEVLATNAKKLLTSECLLQRVWGAGYQTEQEYLRTYISQLRAKLGDRASNPRWIATEPRAGYRWLVEPETNVRVVA